MTPVHLLERRNGPQSQVCQHRRPAWPAIHLGESDGDVLGATEGEALGACDGIMLGGREGNVHSARVSATVT